MSHPIRKTASQIVAENEELRRLVSTAYCPTVYGINYIELHFDDEDEAEGWAFEGTDHDWDFDDKEDLAKLDLDQVERDDEVVTLYLTDTRTGTIQDWLNDQINNAVRVS